MRDWRICTRTVIPVPYDRTDWTLRPVSAFTGLEAFLWPHRGWLGGRWVREKSLNALRQLVDMLANDELPGLYLVITGTPAFFDDYKGLKGLAPLYQRIATKFDPDPKFDNLRAPQVRLSAFDHARLLEVGRLVRNLFPARDGARKMQQVNDAFLGALTQKVTSGFGGKVSVAPRVFLRELVDVLDKVDQYADYDPAIQYGLQLDEAELTPEEMAAVRGDEPVALAGEPAAIGKPRLDG